MTKYMKLMDNGLTNIAQDCPRIGITNKGDKITNLHLSNDDMKRSCGFYPVIDDRPPGKIKDTAYVLEGNFVRRIYTIYSAEEIEAINLDDFRNRRSQLLPHLNWTQNDLSISGLTATQRDEMTAYIQHLLAATQLPSTEAYEVFKTCPEWFKVKQHGDILSIIENGTLDV